MSHRFVPPTASVSNSADVRLERVERQFRQAERMAGIGTWRLSLADNRCEWSDQVFAIHGQAVGESPSLEAALDFYPAGDRKIVADAIARTIATGEPFTLETDLITANGARRRVRSMGDIELSDGVPVGLIGVLQDISDQHAIQQRLRHAAATDDLTGLANRGAFTRHLDDRIAVRRASGVPLALLLIDLDGFKAVNDAFGHLAGDDVLRDVAAVLRGTGDKTGFSARIGGDEFALVVTGNAACARLDAIVATVLAGMRRAVTRGGRTIDVSACIGVAWLDGEIGGHCDLIARADAALYEAKRVRPGSARTFSGGVAPGPVRRRAFSVV